MLPNPAPAGQITITPDDGIAAFKADMRMEMEALRRDIQNIPMGKGKQVAENPRNNNQESIPPSENLGSQEQ